MAYTRTISANPPYTDLARYVKALVLARGDKMNAVEIASQWRDSPAVELVLKAATSPMSTAGDAAPLAEYGVAQQLIEAQRGISVLVRLSGLMRSVPFRTRVVRETTSATHYWVAELGVK